MKGASVLFFLGICTNWALAVFLNHRPFPTYSLENMPDTSFSCRDKILGGYYADADAQCQMFHICVKVAGIGIQDFRFLCPNGTAFDQDHQICAEWEDIDCDATTLYYSSDNFDLYRLGSGFESKPHKYGEDEETFALQRAETGDARINREQQAKVVDQTKQPKTFSAAPRQKYNNNNNNEREIFKSSSSSNFYNNRNNGKERDEDYDDNVNINQNQDYEQKRKVVRNKSRRPVQNRNEQNENNQNANKNNEYNRNQNNEYNRNQNNEYNRNNQNESRKENRNNEYNNRNNEYNRNQNNNYNRNQNNDNNRNQNNDSNRNQNNDYNRNQNNDYNRNQNNDYNRNQNTDYNKNQNTDYNRNQNTDYNKNQNNNTYYNDYNKNNQAAQTRRPVTKFTGFVNNFAGSYEPTTSRPTSTTLNSEQYTTAINNYKSRNGQRRPQTSEYTDSPVYTISTPAPFRQQQYNSPPSRSTNNAQYTSAAPKQSTNYDDNYDIPKVKSTVAQDYNTQYDIPKVKPASSTGTQYNTQKTTVSQYETTKTKQTFKSPGSERTENYPSNNPKYTSNFEKKPTTPFKQDENYPTTLNPKPFSVSINNNNNNNNNNNFPTTFAPRTNAAYSQIAQQTSNYNQNRQSTQNSPSSFNSTPRSTPFTQYTPTVPKLSSTTPVSRSSRFDETQYDDGSYSSKYDYDGDRRDDEFLKTAHSQNIAASRNELQRTSNNKQQTTQSASQPSRTTYDVPKTYPSTPKDVPRINPSTSQFTKDTPRTYPSTAVTKDVPRTYQSSQVTKDVPRTYPSTPQVTKDVPRTYPLIPQVTKDSQRTYPSTPQATKDVSRTFPSSSQATKGSSQTFAPTSQATESPKTSSQPVNKRPAPRKKDYDYAYYDTGVASEPDYEIDTEIKKSTVKN
uniref:Probable serine/threonine-protein kinase clkA isoform X2 n=1 Tax=Diabrotica virgifera virgifera TaxID=50390 RepID=A0A6P7F5R2_DIAVI